jgi:hypothetical protein
LSVTVPEKLPVACPQTAGENKTTANAISRMQQNLLLIVDTPPSTPCLCRPAVALEARDPCFYAFTNSSTYPKVPTAAKSYSQQNKIRKKVLPTRSCVKRLFPRACARILAAFFVGKSSFFKRLIQFLNRKKLPFSSCSC